MIDFPALHPCPNGQIWNGNVVQAYDILSSLSSRARILLDREDGEDPLRLNILAREIDDNSPLLEGMGAEGLRQDWVLEAAISLALTRDTLVGLANSLNPENGLVFKIHPCQPSIDTPI